MDAPRRTSGLRAGAVGVVAALALAACASAPEVAAPPAVQRGQTLPVELGDLTARDVGRAHTAFGLDLLHLLCAQAPDENTTVSPTSAALALGLLHPAARGTTAETFGDLLHLPAWSPELAAALQAHDAG
ncbi:serpin family protein, partial [Actinotalea sp. C106]|uniref:serpin family protein n=1 Tax=Actinotalea sp. C106 TaxID=2908644 RepID=UPI002028DC79